MEIRVLRGLEVRQLLPMADGIDLMHRTRIAVSERRVAPEGSRPSLATWPPLLI